MSTNPQSTHSLTLLTSLPPTCHYLPNFLTPTEESHILTQIGSTPSPRWTDLSHRRLLSLPSTLTGARHDTLIAAPLPAYLTVPILPRFAGLGLFETSPHGAPNHVLVNEYRPGQGIMPHEDGPAYFPCTATVSLGAAVVLDVLAKKNGDGEHGDDHRSGKVEESRRWRILQEPRSLLVTSGRMYTETLHGIEGVTVDEEVVGGRIANWELLGEKDKYGSLEGGRYERGLRVSLTYRDVVKVAKVGGAMRFLGKGQ